MRGRAHPRIIPVPHASLSILTEGQHDKGVGVCRLTDLSGLLVCVMYGTDERGEPALEAVEEAIKTGGFPGGIPGRKGI